MDYSLDSSGTYLPEVKTWRTPAPRKVESSLSSHLLASAVSPTPLYMDLCKWEALENRTFWKGHSLCIEA